MAADDYAVVVGIARYPELGNLGGPEYDAGDFVDWLTKTAGVPDANITKVLSSSFPPPPSPIDAEPTTLTVQKAFEKLVARGRTSGGRVGRRLYIYMAGHGFAPELEETALLMANASQFRTGYHIPGRPYANWFRQAAYFDEVVLFMDCCRENYPVAPPQPVPFDRVSGAHEARYFYGFAAGWSRAAQEIPGQDGKPRGLFTLALLDGLRGKAVRDGQITARSLADYVYNYLQDYFRSQPANERQEPRFDPLGPPGGGLDFGGVAAVTFHVRVTLTGGSGPVEIFNGALQAVAGGGSPVAGAWEWHLPPGLYVVKAPGRPSQYLELVGAGGERDIAL